MTIRNIPEEVHDALRRIAAERRVAVEALVREQLVELVKSSQRRGIDFERIARKRAELGIHEDGPSWTAEMDDPALSRRVLGLEPDWGDEPPP